MFSWWWIKSNALVLLIVFGIGGGGGYLWHKAKVAQLIQDTEDVVRIRIIEAQAILHAEKLEERRKLEDKHLSTLRDENQKVLEAFTNAVRENDRNAQPTIVIDPVGDANSVPDCSIYIERLRQLGKEINRANTR